MKEHTEEELSLRWVAVLLLGICWLAGVWAAEPASAASVHKMTVVLKEFSITPSKLEWKVGENVELTIRNEGQVAHDWMAGSGPVNTQEEKGYRKDLVALLKPKEAGRQWNPIRVGQPSKIDSIKRLSAGVEIEPGGEVTLRFTVPASAKGEWEMACLITGHYESGMKGTIVIR